MMKVSALTLLEGLQGFELQYAYVLCVGLSWTDLEYPVTYAILFQHSPDYLWFV